MKASMKRARVWTLMAVVFSGLWGLMLGYLHYQDRASVLDRVEATLTDVRTLLVGHRTPPDGVTIIAIDDRTAGKEGYPLPRATLARLLDHINAFGPRVVALDLLLIDPGTESGDGALAASLAQGRSIIGAAAIFPQALQTVRTQDGDPLSRIPVAQDLALPLKRFADVADVAIVNVITDHTGTPRFVPLIARSEGRLDIAFPLRVAARALEADPVFDADGIMLGGHQIATDYGQRLPVTFYGPRGTITTISAADVLSGEVAAGSLKDRIVVLGSSVTGSGDFFHTPFDPVLPGVEVISTAISHLVSGDGMIRNRMVRMSDAVLAVLLPVVIVLLIAWRQNAVGLMSIVVLMSLWLATNLLAFSNGIWMSAALPLVATVPTALVFGATQLWLGRRRALAFSQESALLQRVHAPGFADWLAKNPDFLIEPTRQNAAIVFIDLSGFTGLSESVGANVVREILSDFYEVIDQVVRSHRGAITGYMGDGAMILFGLPKPESDDALRAINCSVELCAKVKEWLATAMKGQPVKVGFKMGAHFGPVVASRLGGRGGQQITAIGDTVNVASRLMEVAASHGSELAISNALVKAVNQPTLLSEHKLQGPISAKIRGRSGSIDIWLLRNDDA
jgi:adenylate cyclase